MRIKNVGNNTLRIVRKINDRFVIANAKCHHDDVYDEDFGSDLVKLKFKIKESETRIKIYKEQLRKIEIQKAHFERLIDFQNTKALNYSERIDKLVREKYKN